MKNELIKYIKNIGFVEKIYLGHTYYENKCENLKVSLFPNDYQFFNGEEWFNRINYNDYTMINKYMIKKIRSNKLKKILNK